MAVQRHGRGAEPRRDPSAAQLEWTLTGYVLAFAALMMTGGRLGDLYGRRKVFLAGVVTFTAA